MARTLIRPAYQRITTPNHDLTERGLAGPWPRSVESRIYCPEGATFQIRPIVARGRVVGTRLLAMRKDAVGTPTNHVLDGRHVIVDVTLRAKSGGISFDPNYCDRTSIR